MKRSLDVFISLLALTVLFPLFLIIGFLIIIDSKGPIIFKQERVGLDGRPFFLYKFRSMYTEIKGAHYTSENDPRVTKVGRFIRRTSLDELPQILNVLKGDMSLVGPRPNVFAQKNEYTEEHWNTRNSVLPGITGLAQVTFRSLATPEERLNLDLEYVRNRDLLLDLKILLQTFFKLFLKNGN